MPHPAPQAYGDSSYWENRYKQDAASFDWYQQFSGLAALLQKYIPKASRVLMAGCGNARLSEDMINDGYQEVINIDLSSVVIEAMQKKYQHIPALKYIRMDVRDLSSFEDGQFDAVVDKGTLDSLMCGPSAALSVAKMVEEVRRVLKPGGVYILITYGDPRVRMPHLKAEENCWTVTLHILPKPGSNLARGKLPWAITDPVPLKEDHTLSSASTFVDSDVHYVYVCAKVQDVTKGTPKGGKQKGK